MKILHTSRREFLASGLVLPLAGMTSERRSDTLSAQQLTKTSGELSYRILGKTGLKVTTVGFGCMITSDASVIERAADLGITYFDTARSYQHGNNERMVGAALKRKRHEITLSSKSDARTRETALAELDTSLRELGTDHLDVWYLHSRDRVQDVPDEVIEAQQIAKKQGKIRFAGVSTHNPKTMIPWMVQKGAFDVVLSAYNFSMNKSVEAALEQANRSGLGVVAMKVMAGGYRRVKPDDPLHPKLKREGAMLAALKWVIKSPSVHTTIPSMTDMEQLDENLRAMTETFGPADERLLAAQLEFIQPVYCRLCGTCEGTCAQGLPVANMLRFLSYADGYGQFALGREKFRELPARIAEVRCTGCSVCTVNCPYGVQVSSQLSRAQELFA